MALLEPEVIRFPATLAPCASFEREDKDELLALCKIWDAAGLLDLAPGPLPDRALTRVFGAFKAEGVQRQIGDRRGQNSKECKLDGVSRFLPTGPLLCRLHVPRGCCLVGSVTDRRDFYTQAGVSFERSRTNTCGPAFSLADFRGTGAYRSYRHRVDSGEAWALTSCEGVLDFPQRSILASDSSLVHPTFLALLQGDAGGVEFATSAHEGLLQEFGCLQGRGRLQSGA